MTYICPLRAQVINNDTIQEQAEYWNFLFSQGCEVIVIDGSPPEVFHEHKRQWKNVRLEKVDNSFGYLNGKVNAIWTALPMASCEKIILADDDIIYKVEDLERMFQELGEFEVVRPQNYFHPQELWTRIDSARILWNRSAFKEGDFPGTLGFQKQVLLRAGHYDGDVLFDNEELVKHFQNKKARISFALDFFIERRPPGLKKWLEQRPRQAYEDFIMRKRTWFFFSLVPAFVLLKIMDKRRLLFAGFTAVTLFSILKALKGRKKNADKYFPIGIVLFSPLWVIERSLSIYVALYWKVTKGGYPFGDKIVQKGTGREFEAALKNSQKRNRIFKLTTII